MFFLLEFLFCFRYSVVVVVVVVSCVVVICVTFYWCLFTHTDKNACHDINRESLYQLNYLLYL